MCTIRYKGLKTIDVATIPCSDIWKKVLVSMKRSNGKLPNLEIQRKIIKSY